MTRTVDLLWDVEEEQPEHLLSTVFLEALESELNLVDWEVAVRVVSDEEMRRINKSFRSIDRITDVLSFPAALYNSAVCERRHLGDLLICWAQTLRQADKIGQAAAVEFRFLFLHGLLHLLGYDHENDRGEMMKVQAEIKKKLKRFFM
ncbi:MAG: rRNA maturation RNase YbeY [Acidobacteria bacterium]|nr:MAG: rRNA maturation RNase YbeY [Acidobacteriota bacterium]